MIDNALRAAEGRTIAEHRAEIAGLWARMNAGGGDQSRRRLSGADGRRRGSPPRRRPTGRSPSRTTSGTRPSGRSTRPPRWCCARWTAAERLGVAGRPVGLPPGGPGVEPRRVGAVPCSGSTPGRPWRSSGGTAAARLGRPLDEVEVVELYSCFPAAVRVQQRCPRARPDGTPDGHRRAWPSPVVRSTTSCSSRWPPSSRACATAPDRLGHGHHGQRPADQARARRVVGPPRRPPAAPVRPGLRGGVGDRGGRGGRDARRVRRARARWPPTP